MGLLFCGPRGRKKDLQFAWSQLEGYPFRNDVSSGEGRCYLFSQGSAADRSSVAPTASCGGVQPRAVCNIVALLHTASPTPCGVQQ